MDDSIDNFPGFIWIKDNNFEYQRVNDAGAKLFKYKSERDLLGKNDYELSWDVYADHFRHYDKKIIQGESIDIIHPSRTCDGDDVFVYSSRKPFRDENDAIKGIKGTLIFLDNNPLTNFMHHLSQYDKKISDFDANKLGYNFDDNYRQYNLSKQQSKVIFYLMRGRQSKHIASIMNLSHRTVDYYIEIIKNKLNCSTRPEIIEKCINEKLFSIIPHGICEQDLFS